MSGRELLHRQEVDPSGLISPSIKLKFPVKGDPRLKIRLTFYSGPGELAPSHALKDHLVAVSILGPRLELTDEYVRKLGNQAEMWAKSFYLRGRRNTSG